MLLPLFPIYMHSFSVEKPPFRPGEIFMLPHYIFSLDTEIVAPPPLLSVFYQRLLMSHFSIGGIFIMFFFIDLLLLLMFAVIWGNSWPPGTKRLSFSCLWGLNCVLHLCWFTLTTNCASSWHPITVWLCAFFHTQFCKFITCDCQCKPCMVLKCLYLVF